ncbi:hypothetical protein [Anoxybacillus sp. P3H1B]
MLVYTMITFIMTISFSKNE